LASSELSVLTKFDCTLGSRHWYVPITRCFIIRARVCVCRYQYISRASLSVCTRPLYRYQEVAWAQASLSVQCTDNEGFTDKFWTDSESDNGVSSCTDNKTTVYILYICLKRNNVQIVPYTKGTNVVQQVGVHQRKRDREKHVR